MKKIFYYTSCGIAAMYFLISCSKPNSPAKPATPNATPAQVLNNEADLIIEPSYVSFENNTQNLYTALIQLQNNPSVATLTSARSAFINATIAYEQCESFNFGPTTPNGDDGAVNTYPIDTNHVDTLLNGQTVFTQNNVSNLPGNYKGFHCIEFVLYGGNGNKTTAQFTARQYNYMDSLALNILGVAQQLALVWNPSNGTTWSTANITTGNYNAQFVNAGNSSTVYTSQKSALQDLIFGLYNYCDIDEIQKLAPPLKNNSAAQQESPFANYSVQDVYNNIIGVSNCYLGQYGSTTGYGLSSLVSPGNPSLDNKIRTDINNAINYVNAVQPNLTQALSANPNSIQLAINYCDTLDKDLKLKVLPYINSIVP